MPDGDQGRWLSYLEMGELLGCTANAARMHAVRRNWPRRSPNRVGDCATVLVPKGLDVMKNARNGCCASHERVRRFAMCDGSSRRNGPAPPTQRAERIARDEAAGLRAELDARKQWGLWRRVRGR